MITVALKAWRAYGKKRFAIGIIFPRDSCRVITYHFRHTSCCDNIQLTVDEFKSISYLLIQTIRPSKYDLRLGNSRTRSRLTAAIAAAKISGAKCNRICKVASASETCVYDRNHLRQAGDYR